MKESILKRKYFEWLCNFVKTPEMCNYKNLLLRLFRIDFYAIIPTDENRASDGIELRYRFGREKKLHASDVSSVIDVTDCSVLEMMIALCLRCEEQIIDSPDTEYRTKKMFWRMIRNLGLISMNDDKYDEFEVEERMDIFLNREYEPNGTGGLFHLKRPRNDLRDVEIWYQMMWYLNEQHKGGFLHDS